MALLNDKQASTARAAECSVIAISDGSAPQVQFAMKLTSLAAENGMILPMEWWVYNSHGLNPPMKAFLDKLEPLLDRNETRQLVEATGKWPDYPETIQKLARAG